MWAQFVTFVETSEDGSLYLPATVDNVAVVAEEETTGMLCRCGGLRGFWLYIPKATRTKAEKATSHLTIEPQKPTGQSKAVSGDLLKYLSQTSNTLLREVLETAAKKRSRDADNRSRPERPAPSRMLQDLQESTLVSQTRASFLRLQKDMWALDGQRPALRQIQCINPTRVEDAESGETDPHAVLEQFKAFNVTEQIPVRLEHTRS